MPGISAAGGVLAADKTDKPYGIHLWDVIALIPAEW